MSAIWLQKGQKEKYRFLDPNRPNKLELWVFRSPNFGFKYVLALAAIAKNNMGKFYRQYFPEGRHKLKNSDITQVENILRVVYSDDVMLPVYLPMLEDDQKKPSYKHHIGY